MRHDVVIYATSSRSAGFYDRSIGRDGGAERQMTVLARALVERGHRVAHIIFPPREPAAVPHAPTLVHRAPRHSGNRIVGGLLEARTVWRALWAADAAVVVLRSASPLVGVAALFCKLRRRAFIFSTSNVSDLTLEKMPSRKAMPYRLGLRLADAVVVQSNDQRALALRAFPSLPRVVHIPSFADVPREQPTDGPSQGEAFLWFGRPVPAKQPVRYVELARSLPEARFLMIPAWAGEDPSLLEELRKAAQSVSNLTLLDPLRHAQLLELIRRSVAVVNTSSLEGMPNAFLEAWGCGVPVLTLQFDPDDVVARQRLGIAAGGSWERFVAGARELWESRSADDGFARRARSYVDDVHSVESVAERWRTLIDEVR
jgi:glycosyltransferase involved in cell wall biosynthesis